MAMNPMLLLKVKDRLNIFRSEHPKVAPFFRMIREEGLEPGAVLELKVTMSDGRDHVTNIRLTENDIETLKMLSRHKDKDKD